MTNSISEIANADVIFVIGSNTTENHPVLALEIKKAVVQNGAKLIVADPRRIELVDYAAIWLNQQPGTDVALVNGMINAILAAGLANEAFVAERTEGISALAESVSGYTPEEVEKVTGVKAADLIACRALICGIARRVDPLCHGHHPAYIGDEQRPRPRQPVDGDRADRQAVLGRQSLKGSEQRPGRLRHGRAAECLHRVPEGG